MTQKDMITWGILGCGDVTEVKSGPALRGADRSDVAAVMRRDGDKAADYARRHGIASSTDKADTLLAMPELNAIYIATPPSTHAEYAIRAMRAGKDVLVEKPMALSTDECRSMEAAMNDTGRKLVIAYYRRALPRFERLREIVQGGEIGEPRLIEVRHFMPADARPGQSWKVDPAVGGGGFFADMQTHALDWLGHVFGAPRAVRGLSKRQAGNYAAEDLVTYLIDFGALTAVGTCSYATTPKEESVTIHGSSGSASMGFFRPSPITLTGPDGSREIDLPDPPHVHQPFVERVIAHFLDDAPNPCPPSEAMRVNEMLETIYAGT
ncbi:Gfo/Idh/MocA family oxidoreductase [Sulfitobacter sp. D35]|uniref:Gfo/Idh/MocA family protein n=1 Tax=Sulfitobacter sp. D35 TaxID=3083252 RepID=UPI00296FF44F|nr:Gfo/Idh/MocA family oxidoreductase [Sulfitobacter sp. D35]MDW4498460.1 Gfo/Idh/MocA family oxidoreductase [Sulfitobacter sp. D35]